VSLSAIHLSKANVLRRGTSSTPVAIAALRSVVFVVTATLLILVALPAALVAAGT
jgi:hypothetical protein